MDIIPGDPVQQAIVCVIFFALWAVFLVLVIGGWRAAQVLTGAKKPNDFPSGTPHGGDRYWRLNRAHINTLENLPIFATVVIGLALLGLKTELFGQLAQLVLFARVLQSLIHISSGSVLAVNLRFAAYAVQLAAILWMAVHGLRAEGTVYL